MLFVGIDISTQSATAVIINKDSLSLPSVVSIPYSSLQRFPSERGVLNNADATIAHADPRMFVEALIQLFSAIQTKGIDLSNVSAISGCAQQHGTVYLNSSFLSEISPAMASPDLATLPDRIGLMLSRPTAPIWMVPPPRERLKRAGHFHRRRVRGARRGCGWRGRSSGAHGVPPHGEICC